MKKMHIYTWLIAIGITAIGCAKSVFIPLEVTDIKGNPIQEADLTLIANGKEVPVEFAEASGEKGAKVKVGETLIVTAKKDGFRSTTQKQTVTMETGRIPLQIEPFRPDFKLEMTLSNRRVVTGTPEACDVTITLTNQGKGDAFNVEVRGNIPEGVQPTQSTGSPQGVGDSRVWRLSRLKAGDSYEVSYRLKPTDTAHTGQRLVKIEASGSDVIQDAVSVEKSDEFQVTGRAILEGVQYEATPRALNLTQVNQVQYTLKFRNSGGGKTAAITVFMSLPEGFTLDEASLKPGVPVTRKGSASYALELPPLPSGGIHELTYTATISKETKKGSKESRVALSTLDEADQPIQESAAATVDITQTPQPAVLVITKSMRDGPRNTLRCELSIRNNGNGSARQVEITDALPNGFSLELPIDLKKNESSEYEVVSIAAPKTEVWPQSYQAGLLKFGLAKHPSALMWAIDKLGPTEVIQMAYEIKSKDAESLLALGVPKGGADAKEEKPEIVTPLTVTVTALDEWDKKITVSANATYRKTTNPGPRGEIERIGKDGRPPVIR